MDSKTLEDTRKLRKFTTFLGWRLDNHTPVILYYFFLTVSAFFIWLFNPFTLNVIIDTVGFTSATLLFVFYVSHVFLFPYFYFTAFFCIKYFPMKCLTLFNDFFLLYLFIHIIYINGCSRAYHIYFDLQNQL